MAAVPIWYGGKL